jgi:CheY-like chemotaxis protein
MEQTSLILVADDHLHSREALASLLEPEGYRLAFAADGPEVLAITRLITPDLVLLDVMMPGMDGFEVCRHLRADATLAIVPIVMLTTLDDPSSRLRGIEAGADDFIAKPFNRHELRARVRTITRLNRFRTLLNEQQRASAEHAQLLWTIEQSADGYLLLDAKDHAHYANVQARQYLQLGPEPTPLPAAPFTSLIGNLYRREDEQAWAIWPEASQKPRYLVRPETASVAALWIKVDLLDQPPGPSGCRVLRLHDVTAQVSANWERQTFHHFIAHKLRTPLTAVLGSAGLLAREERSITPTQIAPLVSIIHHGVQRLKLMVDDVLSYVDAPLIARPGEGLPLTELPALIERTTAVFDIKPVGPVILTELGDKRLVATAATVELMISELLENACKFHPSQRPVVVITVRQTEAMATIHIEDDGQSIPPERLARIWEPYHQIEKAFTGQIPGSGLGLATVARTTWGMGGACRIANRSDGPGIMVELDIPLDHTRRSASIAIS